VQTRLALISSNVKQSCVECVHGGREGVPHPINGYAAND
jgi:hypothetical protein